MLKAYKILKKYFGYTSFKEGQEPIIKNILEGHDTLGIMPTGGGKSICYQIPALIFEGITIVVSPLISLMQDQVDALNTLGISSIYINSTLKPKEMKTVYMEISNGDHKIIYVTPERFENSEFIDIDGERVQLTYYKTDDFILGLDELINKMQYLEKSSLCIILCGNNKKINIVGRSSNKINVAEILKKYNVGGHEYAVSGMVKDQEIEKLYLDIKKSIKMKVKPGKKSIDIMNTPVKTILKDTKIKLAYKIMYRMGYGGLPIVEDGKVVGIITRNSVDKALNHGFSNAPVSAYMTSEVITGDKNLSVEELKSLIVEKGIGRIPIVDDEKKIVGIVTRTDILKSIYSKNPIRKAKKLKFELDVKNNIAGVVPAELIKLLKIIEIQKLA